MVDMHKRGWIRIMEATIAALIVLGVLIVVYSNQVSENINIEESVLLFQGKILGEIASSETLRLYVLNVSDDSYVSTDPSYRVLTDFVNLSLPDNFNFDLRVCNLNATSCKLNNNTFIETQVLDRDVYADETIVSSELIAGTGSGVYAPRKIRLFVWEA